MFVWTLNPTLWGVLISNAIVLFCKTIWYTGCKNIPKMLSFALLLMVINIGVSNSHRIPTENPIGTDGTVAGNAGNGSPETCNSGTTQLCQPNVYIAPTINCSSVEILTELNLLRQQMTELKDRVHRLANYTGSSTSGTIFISQKFSCYAYQWNLTRLSFWHHNSLYCFSYMCVLSFHCTSHWDRSLLATAWKVQKKRHYLPGNDPFYFVTLRIILPCILIL